MGQTHSGDGNETLTPRLGWLEFHRGGTGKPILARVKLRVVPIRPIQNAGEHLPRIRFFHLGNLLGRALRDDAAAAFGA